MAPDLVDDGTCDQCGHDVGPHTLIATGQRPTDGGVIICQVKGCPCLATWNVPQVKPMRPVIEPSEAELAQMRHQFQSEEP